MQSDCKVEMMSSGQFRLRATLGPQVGKAQIGEPGETNRVTRALPHWAHASSFGFARTHTHMCRMAV